MAKRELMRSGINNSLDDEYVAWEGYSDWGDKGWFIGTECDMGPTDPRTGHLFSKIFMTNKPSMERLKSFANSDKI